MAEATASGLQPDLSSYKGYDASNKLLATANNTPQAAADWINVARQGQALNQDQLTTARMHLSALNDIVSSVMADPTQQNATARITDGIRAGAISADDGARGLQTVASFGGDPNAIRQYAFQHGQNIATLQQRMNAAYGAPGTVDNGQTISPVVTREGPQAGVYAAGGNAMQK